MRYCTLICWSCNFDTGLVMPGICSFVIFDWLVRIHCLLLWWWWFIPLVKLPDALLIFYLLWKADPIIIVSTVFIDVIRWHSVTCWRWWYDTVFCCWPVVVFWWVFCSVICSSSVFWYSWFVVSFAARYISVFTIVFIILMMTIPFCCIDSLLHSDTVFLWYLIVDDLILFDIRLLWWGKCGGWFRYSFGDSWVGTVMRCYCYLLLSRMGAFGGHQRFNGG